MVSHPAAATIGGLAPTSKEREFLRVNPGDIFMVMAFVWALACLLLLVGGDRITRMIARTSRTAALLLSDNQVAIVGMLVVGVIVIAGIVYFFNRTPRTSFIVLVWCYAIANYVWPPAHYTAFAFKYISMAYLGVYTALWLYRNFWRLDLPAYRLILVWLGWMLIVAVVYGGRLNDYWHLATRAILIFSVAIYWVTLIDSDEQLLRFNRMLALAAFGMTGIHMISPFLVGFSEVFISGRFVAGYPKATGFGLEYSPMVLVLVWQSLADPNRTYRRLAAIAGVIGIAMILLSGTRNATVALLASVLVLSYVFRARIIVYVLAAAFIGLIMQILVLDTSYFEDLGERLSSTRNTRLEIWARYLESIFREPLLGYGPAGGRNAIYSASVAGLLERYNIAPTAVHNAMLGTAVRFGIPGLLIYLTLFFTSFKRCFSVLTDRAVPQVKKAYFVLYAALATLFFLEGFFEDNIASPRGTLSVMLFSITLVFTLVIGSRILEEAHAQVQAKRVTA